MKKLFVLVLISLAATAHAWTQRPPQDIRTCAVHAPYGMPAAIGTQPICRQAYLVGYDITAKIPRFVTYELIPKNTLGCVPRTMRLLLINQCPMVPHPMTMPAPATTKAT